MFWDYLLTFILLIVGLLGIFLDKYFEGPKPLKLTFLLSALILAAAIIQFYQTYEENRKEKYSEYSGKISGNERIEYPAIKLGTAILEWKGKPGEPMIKIGEDSIIVWLENGRPMISTTLRNEEGDIIAKIDGNQWTINPNLIFDRNFDDRALEVINSKGDVVLQIEVEEDGIAFAGIFYRSDGWRIALGENVFELRPPGEEIEISFERIFEYPSSLHPGKRKN